MEQFFEVAGEQLNETGAVIMGHRSFDQIYSEQGGPPSLVNPAGAGNG